MYIYIYIYIYIYLFIYLYIYASNGFLTKELPFGVLIFKHKQWYITVCVNWWIRKLKEKKNRHRIPFLITLDIKFTLFFVFNILLEQKSFFIGKIFKCQKVGIT